MLDARRCRRRRSADAHRAPVTRRFDTPLAVRRPHVTLHVDGEPVRQSTRSHKDNYTQ
jgi:hypothetical protein